MNTVTYLVFVGPPSSAFPNTFTLRLMNNRAAAITEANKNKRTLLSKPAEATLNCFPYDENDDQHIRNK